MSDEETTTTTEAWAPAIPGLKKGIGYTQNWYNDPSKHPLYTGRFTPENDPRRAEALAGTESLARGLKAQNFGQPYMDVANKFLGYLGNRTPGVKSFGSYDPTPVRNVVDTLVRPQTEQFQQQILPGIYDNLDRTGAAHNSRAAIPLANAGEQYARGISDTATQFGYKDFSDTRNMEMQLDQFLLQALPGLMASGVSLADAPNKMLDFVGQGAMGLEGNEIQNALLENQYARDMPYQDLSRYLNSMIALGSTGSTSTTVQSVDPISTALQVAGGLGAAYMTGNPGALAGIFGGANSGVGVPQMLPANPMVIPGNNNFWNYLNSGQMQL